MTDREAIKRMAAKMTESDAMQRLGLKIRSVLDIKATPPWRIDLYVPEPGGGGNSLTIGSGETYHEAKIMAVEALRWWVDYIEWSPMERYPEAPPPEPDRDRLPRLPGL